MRLVAVLIRLTPLSRHDFRVGAADLHTGVEACFAVERSASLAPECSGVAVHALVGLNDVTLDDLASTDTAVVGSVHLSVSCSTIRHGSRAHTLVELGIPSCEKVS